MPLPYQISNVTIRYVIAMFCNVYRYVNMPMPGVNTGLSLLENTYVIYKGAYCNRPKSEGGNRYVIRYVIRYVNRHVKPLKRT